MRTIKSILILLVTVLACSCANKERTTADLIRADVTNSNKNLYVIEREIPGAGNLTTEELQGISQVSCGVLEEMGGDIEWLHSYVMHYKMKVYLTNV